MTPESPIADLEDLDVRSYNLLFRNGYRSVAAVCACTEKQLKEIGGLGPLSLKNIKEALSNVGFTLSG